MKIRIISLLLAAVLLLCGCAGEVQQNPTVTTETASLEEYREKVIAAAEVVTYDAEPVIEFDPDREVYISLANRDCDFYPGYWFAKGNVMILTKEHLDIDQIQVNVPMKTAYTVDIKDFTEDCSLDSGSTKTLQLYQYMCMQGADWQEIGQLQACAQAAIELLNQSTADPKAAQAYSALLDEYLNAMEQIFKTYEASYRTLASEDVPHFGAYYVSIRFAERGDYEETVETVEFIIDGKSYNVDIGQWRFRGELPQLFLDGSDPVGLEQIDIVRSTTNNSPYWGSYLYMEDTFTFKVSEDLTITGIHYEGTPLDILGAQVRVSGRAAYFWNMDTPIEVGKGDKVEIDLYLRDDRFGEHSVCITAYPVMDYELRGKSHGLTTPCLLIRGFDNYWDSYLMAFEGTDTGAYYACYGKDHTWLEELPESWLK